MKFETVFFIGAPVDRVWDALINPEVVEKYYLCPLSEIDPVIGGTIKYGGGLISGEITDFEEKSKLSHSFAFAHHPDEPASEVTYRLRAHGEVTELSLLHDGFAAESKTFEDIRGGWPTILSELKSYLETGRGLPWPRPDR